jgi:hypothetical protein
MSCLDKVERQRHVCVSRHDARALDMTYHARASDMTYYTNILILLVLHQHCHPPYYQVAQLQKRLEELETLQRDSDADNGQGSLARLPPLPPPTQEMTENAGKGAHEVVDAPCSSLMDMTHTC